MSVTTEHPEACLKDSLPEVRNWLSSSDTGRYILSAEKPILQDLLPRMFGHHACTLGIYPDASLLDDTHILHKTFLTPLFESVPGNGQATVCLCVNEWGIQPRSMNAVLLHHALDFASRPHRVLREACRAILPGGKLIIVGFNPRSLWNLVRFFGLGDSAVIRRSHFYQPRRIEDWLTLLNFRTTELRYGGGLFPLFCRSNPIYRQRVESFISATGLGIGSFYIMVAVKERSGLIPYDRRWRNTGNGLLGTARTCHLGPVMNNSDKGDT